MTNKHGLFLGGAALAALLVAPALAAPVAVAPEPKPQQMVDALHTAFGDHHSRAVHAKGIILDGTFTPDPAARTITKAVLFAGGEVPVTARFSDFTGIPDIPDNIGDSNPRGFAVKFKPAGETEMDVVSHSFNGFPTKNAAEFRELLLAIGASVPTAPKPNAVEKFLATHPVAKTFLTTQKPPPESYATAEYYGVNAFKFTDAAGHPLFVRYRFVPAAGEHYLDAAALKAKGPDYLQPEITARLAKGPVSFDWYAQIAAKGDVIDNPSVAWPDTRKLVKLGTITITRVTADQASEDHKLLFLPANLPDGIAVGDPMLAVRNGAYPISFRHRQ
jgi:catalase